MDSRFGGDQDEGSNMLDVIDWMSPFVYRSRGGWLMHTCMKALVIILSNKGLLLLVGNTRRPFVDRGAFSSFYARAEI